MPTDTLSAGEALAQAKTAAGVVAFKLKDHEGKIHTYECTPHGYDGADWCIEVAGLIAEPLARLAQGNLGHLIKAFMGAKSLEDLDLEALARELDQDGSLGLRAATSDVVDSLRKLGSYRLGLLLKHTRRDGMGLDLSSPEQRQNYDRAFAANWREWREALFKVFQINRFADFLFSSSDSGTGEANQVNA